MDIHSVVLSKLVLSNLKKLPEHIVTKLLSWVDAIEHTGLITVRKLPGYHDEPLKGNRKGQRSIRLSRAYRAIYRIKEDGDIEIIEVMEVSKHDY